MFDFFFRYFLLFPKVVITSHWGILIGEMVLIAYWGSVVLVKNRLMVSSVVTAYYAFVIYFVLLSSLITAIHVWFIPSHAMLYIVRIFLCLGLFIWAYDYGLRKGSSPIQIVRYVYNRPFVVHFLISLVIMSFYYAMYKPEPNFILWGYEVGLRMVPIAGMVISPDGFFFLDVISGSGNLIAGWALAILIVNFALGKGNYSKWIVVVAVLTVLLSLSRGGFLTIALYLGYVFLKNFDFKISIRTLMITSVVVVALIFYFSIAETIALPNIFDRLSNTYDSSGFDGSTAARLTNYIALLNTWTTKWYYILFGFGYDEQALMLTAHQTVVESYFLEVLVCSGIVGLALFALFYLVIFVNRLKNIWYKALWEFILFESLIFWTVTGGDFLAPHATYILLTFMGFGLAEERLKINRAAPAPLQAYT